MRNMEIDFDQFTFKLDRWHGEIDFDMPISNTKKLQVSCRGDSSQISMEQKQSIYQFVSNYDSLWAEFSSEIRRIEPFTKQEFDTTISLALSGIVSGKSGPNSYEYIVGYKILRNAEYFKSYMICVNGMRVSEVIVAT